MIIKSAQECSDLCEAVMADPGLGEYAKGFTLAAIGALPDHFEDHLSG